MPKRVRYNGVVHNFPDDATEDEIRSVLEAGDVQAIPSAGMPLPIPQELQPQADIPESLKALTIGVSPAAFMQRAGGAVASVVNTMLPAGDTRKTEPQLPAPTPEEEIGSKALAIGGAAEAVVGGAKALGGWAAEKANLAKIYNRAAGVPAGRRGVEVSMSTGAVKTNPGNAMVRANESKTALGQLTDAFFAKPNDITRIQVQAEFNRAGKAIEAELTKAGDSATIQTTIPDLPKAHQAIGATGLDVSDATGPVKVSMSPIEAHRFRSELGDRINWNPDVLNDGNELLKDAWVDLSRKIDGVAKGIGPLNKEWQEAYLYRKAVKHQLELQSAGKKTAQSMAKRAVKTVAKVGLAGGAYEAVKHLP